MNLILQQGKTLNKKEKTWLMLVIKIMHEFVSAFALSYNGKSCLSNGFVMSKYVGKEVLHDVLV